MTKRTVVLVAALATLGFTLVLVACSGDDSAGAPPSAPQDGSAGDTSAPVEAGPGDDAGDAGTSACPDTGSIAATLECTGLYTDFASKTLAPGVAAYAPSTPFWSDGATKQRWIALPPGTKIDATDPNEWTFPVGTRVWKELSFGGKRIETRLFQKVSATYWVHAAYLWNADDSAAPEFPGGDLPTVLTSDAGTTYHVPTSGECDECHRGRTDHILGFEAVSLGTQGAQGLTLAALASQGLLAPAPAATSLTIGDDGTGKAAPALAWLHVNCGVTCHNANSNAIAYGTGERFRIDPGWLDGRSAKTYDSYTTTVGQTAVSPAWFGQVRIVAGDPDHSLVVHLVGTRTPDFSNQMPPLVTKVVPEDGLAAIRAWIGAMPPAGTDAGADAGEDAGVDAGEDAGADAGEDAGEDAGADAEVDAGEDAADARTGDAGEDASGQASDAATE